MRRYRSYARWAACAAMAIGLVVPTLARANPWDISLRGLGRPDQDPSAFRRYRLLSSELALALSPRPMQPAETLGMSGFEFSITNALTDISEKASYWQGQTDVPIMEGELRGRKVPSALWSTTAHLRKGLPMSTEVGVQATYLAFSELFMIGAELKVALHESYVPWLPALSVRVAGARLLGSSELDLVTAEADVMASYAFGFGGMVQLTPYVGYGQLAAHVNTYVLDDTPATVRDPDDQRSVAAGGSLYSFDTIEWSKNTFPRFFGGLRANVAMLELTYEFNLGLLSFANSKQVASHGFKIGFDI